MRPSVLKTRGTLPLLCALLALGCDLPNVERLPVQDQGLDDRLTLKGTVCTRAADPSDFKVRVVFVIDESGSMCITDPPDAQQAGGLCTNFLAAGGGTTNQLTNPAYQQPNNFCEGDGKAYPGRVCALYQIIKSFVGKPNVEVSLVPFNTTIGDITSDTSAPFDAVDSTNLPAWVTTVNSLQTALGSGTDYQGAFAETYVRIANDIATISKADLPRTRYVVVFLTDGTPFPRCAADDAMPPQDYASPANPDLIWPDSPGALDPDTGANFCNEDALAGILGGGGNATPAAPFVAGTDRNQNYQILDLVDRIMGLQQTFNIADMRVHSILLWNNANISTLSSDDQNDIFGLGNIPNSVAAAHDVAAHLLGEIAQHGNGTYQQFTTSAQLELGTLDYTSLLSPFVMKNLIVDNVTAHPRPDGQVPDSDGDGLPDDIDNQTTLGTYGLYQSDEALNDDTDKDGFDDNFEYAHRQQGFDPTTADERGAVDTTDHTATCSTDDTDGDGLSQCAEEYLKSDITLTDSDSDGVPDGLEARYGLDPAHAESPQLDSDGDGVPDLQEIRAHTDPHVSDADLAGRESYRYDVQVASVDGGVTCYNYAVSNIRMVGTQSEQSNADGTQNGYNHFVIYFDQAPQSNLSRDYGIWKMACATAQYAPPSVRAPQGPDLEVDDKDFIPSGDFVPTSFDWGNRFVNDPSVPHCVQATP
jgi:hypothetical protein